MKPDTRLAIQWSVAAASWVGCAIGGAKLWPKHPIAGGAIGVIVVAPAINAVINAVLPKAEAPQATPERPASNYAGASRENVTQRRDTDSVYMGNDRAGQAVYRPRYTRGQSTANREADSNYVISEAPRNYVNGAR